MVQEWEVRWGACLLIKSSSLKALTFPVCPTVRSYARVLYCLVLYGAIVLNGAIVMVGAKVLYGAIVLYGALLLYGTIVLYIAIVL